MFAGLVKPFLFLVRISRVLHFIPPGKPFRLAVESKNYGVSEKPGFLLGYFFRIS